MSTAGSDSPQASTSRVKLDEATHGDATAPPIKLSRASKDVAFGSLAGMVSKVFEHPFDLVKVRLQTQPEPVKGQPPMFNGAFDCFRQTYLKEGIRGLYRGLSMPVFGATLENASLFFTYNFVQGQLRRAAGIQSTSSSSLEADAERPLPMSYLAVAAACAGVGASLVLTPIELIKCKMQVQMVTREVDALKAASSAGNSAGTAAAREQVGKALAKLDGPLLILKSVLRQDGVRGLWLGQTGTLLRETGGGIAWFLAFEQATRAMIKAKQGATADSRPITKKSLSTPELIVAGALAGISYNVVLFPADCVKSTMQTEREWALSRGPGTAYQPKGFMTTFFDIYRTRGLRGLYAGCGVTCLRSAPSSAIIFLMYNRLEGLADDLGI